MDPNIFDDNHVLKVIKVGRKFYTCWYQNHAGYHFPLTIALLDVNKKYNIGELIVVPKDFFDIEDPSNPNNRSGDLHKFRLLKKDRVVKNDKGTEIIEILGYIGRNSIRRHKFKDVNGKNRSYVTFRNKSYADVKSLTFYTGISI